MVYNFEMKLKETLRNGPDVPSKGLIKTFDTADLVLDWAREKGLEPTLGEVIKMVEVILLENSRKPNK